MFGLKTFLLPTSSRPLPIYFACHCQVGTVFEKNVLRDPAADMGSFILISKNIFAALRRGSYSNIRQVMISSFLISNRPNIAAMRYRITQQIIFKMITFVFMMHENGHKHGYGYRHYDSWSQINITHFSGVLEAGISVQCLIWYPVSGSVRYRERSTSW